MFSNHFQSDLDFQTNGIGCMWQWERFTHCNEGHYVYLSVKMKIEGFYHLEGIEQENKSERLNRFFFFFFIK